MKMQRELFTKNLQTAPFIAMQNTKSDFGAGLAQRG